MHKLASQVALSEALLVNKNGILDEDVWFRSPIMHHTHLSLILMCWALGYSQCRRMEMVLGLSIIQ